MAKITICGDAIVVTSALRLEDIKTVQKYNKSALTLMGGEDNKEPVFAISAGVEGPGMITKYGAEFTAETRDENKFAVLTMACVEHVDSADGIKEYVTDEIGTAISMLNKLEAQIPAVLEQITTERQEIMSNITIAQ